jgi:pectate lyase
VGETTSGSGSTGASSLDDTRGSDSTASTGAGSSSSGDDGSTTGDEDACGGPLVGWAAMNGGTVGGEGGPTTIVTDAAELVALAATPGPQVIVVSGDITLGETLEIASDKTIEGEPGGATIHGSLSIDGAQGEPVTNVIVRNLHIDGADGTEEDAFGIVFAQNVWVDHCDIHDGIDGNLDITHASSFVTVSYTIFRYTANAPDPTHRFSNLIGHSDDNAAEDEDALDVTMHHDWWTTGVVERMPRVRFGQVHAFNNLYDSPDTNYAIRAGVGSEILVEANWFQDIDAPHEVFDEGAELVATGNVYTNGATGEQAGDAFVPPYAYTPDPARDVPMIVETCAGPQ